MYDQADGVAMASPLARILTNIFMRNHENGLIRNYSFEELIYYKSYVDDIFSVFQTKDHAVSVVGNTVI